MAHRGRAGVWVVGVLGVGVAAGGLWAWKSGMLRGPAAARGAKTTTSAVARSRPDPVTPVGTTAVRVAAGQTAAVTELVKLLSTPRDSSTPRLTAEEANEYFDALNDLRKGFGKVDSRAKAAIVDSAGLILARFAADSAPAHWVNCLDTCEVLFAEAMADPSPEVRAVALTASAGSGAGHPTGQ